MENTAQESVLLGDLLGDFTSSLTHESIEQLSKFKVSPSIQAKLDLLAAKCNEGQLNAAERAEYEAYVRVGSFLNVVKAKAKHALKNSP